MDHWQPSASRRPARCSAGHTTRRGGRRGRATHWWRAPAQTWAWRGTSWVSRGARWGCNCATPRTSAHVASNGWSCPRHPLAAALPAASSARQHPCIPLPAPCSGGFQLPLPPVWAVLRLYALAGDGDGGGAGEAAGPGPGQCSRGPADARAPAYSSWPQLQAATTYPLYRGPRRAVHHRLSLFLCGHDPLLSGPPLASRW